MYRTKPRLSLSIWEFEVTEFTSPGSFPGFTIDVWCFERIITEYRALSLVSCSIQPFCCGWLGGVGFVGNIASQFVVAKSYLMNPDLNHQNQWLWSWISEISTAFMFQNRYRNNLTWCVYWYIDAYIWKPFTIFEPHIFDIRNWPCLVSPPNDWK